MYDEDEAWNWYIVAGYSPYHGGVVTEAVPVCAAGFDEAMTVYEILLKLMVSE